MIDNKTIRKVIMLNKMLPSGSPTYENREASGDVANFTTNVVMPFVKCECTIDATESGTSVLNVEQAGKNIFDAEKIVEDSNNQYVYIQDGYLRFTTRDNRNFSFDNLKLPCPVSFSGTVKSFSAYENLVRIRCVFSDETTQTLDLATLQPNDEISFSRTIGTSGKTLTRIYGTYTSDKAAGFDLSTTQLELGSTATTYEAYSGTTTTVTLEEAAYGGKVDVIAGSGQIIDEHGKLVYTLFEPVSISALEGVNNVWCDTGDIEVTYKYKTGEGGSSTKKYLPIFYDFYGKEKYKHDHS